MTSLVNFSQLCDYEEFRISQKEHISLMLREVQRLASPVYLYFSAERPLLSHIVRMDEKSGSVVLAHTPAIENVRRIIASGVFVVVDHMHTQIQFHVEGLAQLTKGAGSDYLISQPEKLYLIQRRVSLRRAIPADDLACCCLELTANTSLKLSILDLSDDGLALMDSECSLSHYKGETIADVYLSLPTGRVRCDLEILNSFSIYLAGEHKQVCRLGCRIHGMSQGDSELYERYIQSLDT